MNGTPATLHVDQCGAKYWVKYHFRPTRASNNLTEAEGRDRGPGPDHHIKDLYEAIKSGDHRHGRCTCR